MPKYKLNTINEAEEPNFFVLDTDEGTLVDSEGKEVIPLSDNVPRNWKIAKPISPTNPVGKSRVLDVLKIQLGLACNYSCAYCLQTPQIEEATNTNIHDAVEFIEKITQLNLIPKKIEFWGGEPLLYWKKITLLAEALRQKFPNVEFSMITNGSLLTPNKVEFLDRMNFAISISHDGPAQSIRGTDPFNDPEVAECIRELARRLAPKKKISIAAVITPGHCSGVALINWFRPKFDVMPMINFADMLDVFDANQATDLRFTEKDYSELQDIVFHELVLEGSPFIPYFQQRIRNWYKDLSEQKPGSAYGQKCGMDREDHITIDLSGNVVTCQNTGALGHHKIGHIDDYDNISLNTAIHWSNREECSHCPVVQLCKGSCMYLQGDEFAYSCENSYRLNTAVMAAALFNVTGQVLVSIDGDIRRPKKSKVIPIKQI